MHYIHTCCFALKLKLLAKRFGEYPNPTLFKSFYIFMVSMIIYDHKWCASTLSTSNIATLLLVNACSGD